MADSIELLAALDEMHEATAGLKGEELRSPRRAYPFTVRRMKTILHIAS